MLKSNKKSKRSLLKGAVIGLAAVLSLSAAPIAAITSLIPAAKAEDIDNQKSIVLSKAPKNATVGQPYEIQKAKLVTGKVPGTDGKEIVDDNQDGKKNDGAIKSDITVTFKNSNIQETIEPKEGLSGTFTPLRVGTYTISYYAWDESTEYRYQYDIVANIGKASFEFKDNDANILPSYYDKSLMTEPKDVELPMPKLLGEDGEEKKVKDASIKYYGPTSSTIDDTDYVLVYVNNRKDTDINKMLSVDTEKGTAKLLGSELKNAPAGEYTICFAYYSNKQVVEIATKTFTIQEGHYKKSQAENAEAGYDLSVSFVGSKPDKASTGVATPLPTVQATTSSENSPASESVNVHFDVKVYKKNASGEYVEVTGAYDADENTFTPPEDGDYRIDYTVTDFYGNPQKDDLRIWIDGVKDDVPPTVYMYDGGDKLTLTEDGKINYTDARDNFVSEGVNRNIVIYAIGANDNTVKIDNLDGYKIEDHFTSLTREIENASRKSIFTITEYNDYNLIFAFGNNLPENGNEPYKTFVNDNFTIASKMSDADKSTEENIAKYLKEHKYLIVTHSLTNVPGKTGEFFNFSSTSYKDKYASITEGFKPEDLEDYKEALKELGYAYIANEDGNIFTNQTYNVYYKAKDKAGNTIENQYVSLHFTSDKTFEDKAVPTITFSTSLQENYLPDDVITFDAPKFSDNYDRSIKQVVAYRYLKEDRKESIAVEGKSTTLNFVTNKNSVVDGRWYGDHTEENKGAHTGENFILPELENGQYSINLKEKPEQAGWVEIFVYGTDDYGNIGFYNNVVRILGSNDTEAPKLNTVTLANNDKKQQGKKYNLPTLVYSDDLAEYMSHTVDVYLMSSSEVETGAEPAKKTVYEYKKVPSENSRAVAEERRYTLNAGTFTAHEAGTYRVVVTVYDAGNNSIASFFDITVAADPQVEDPTINNLSNQAVELEVDKTYMLSTPTLSLKENTTIKYAGYENRDDSKKAKYYVPVAISAETNYYTLKKNSFVGNVAGKYEIKYYVFLLQYNTTNGTLSTTDDNVLILTKGGQRYVVKPNLSALAQDPEVVAGEEGAPDTYKYPIDKVDLEVYKDDDTDFSDPVDTSTVTSDDLKGITIVKLESKVQTIRVTDTQAPELKLATTEDYTTHRTVGDTIVIQRIAGTDNSAMGINPETSYVEITISKASGGSNTEQIYMKDDDWTKARTGNLSYDASAQELKLKLAEDGNYRIRYSISDYSGNTTTKDFSFANGDAVKPTVETLSGFIDKEPSEYKLGDYLTIDPTKLKLWDDKTDVATLEKNVTITIKNTTNNTTLSPVENTENSYKLDVAGEYEITVTTTDAAGWTGSATPIKISISASSTGDTENVYKIVGTVLLVISCLILVGVIGYFIYSKVKLDKEAKGTGKKKSKK